MEYIIKGDIAYNISLNELVTIHNGYLHVKDGKIVLHDVNPNEKMVIDFQVSGRQNYAMGVEVSGNQE